MSRNILHFMVFLTIIFSLTSLFYLCYNNNCLSNNYITEESNNLTQTPSLTITTSNFTDNIAIISDTHLNSEIFPKLKTSLIENDVKFLIHLGDLTDFGSLSELSLASNDLVSLGISFFAFPGDHDIAASQSTNNFNQYFNSPNFFSISSIDFLYIPNFYNFTPISDLGFKSLLNSIPSAEIVISAQPIYVDPNNLFADKYMASPTAFENLSTFQKNSLVKYQLQRNEILSKLRQSKTPIYIISGDHHRSSNFGDPENPNLKYHIVGSLAKYINFNNSRLLQTSLQSNRYTLLKVGKSEGNVTPEVDLSEIILK